MCTYNEILNVTWYQFFLFFLRITTQTIWYKILGRPTTDCLKILKNPWVDSFRRTSVRPTQVTPTRLAITVKWAWPQPKAIWWAAPYLGAGWPRPPVPIPPLPIAHQLRIFSEKWWVFHLARRPFCQAITRTRCIALKKSIVICDLVLSFEKNPAKTSLVVVP